LSGKESDPILRDFFPHLGGVSVSPLGGFQKGGFQEVFHFSIGPAMEELPSLGEVPFMEGALNFIVQLVQLIRALSGQNGGLGRKDAQHT
jgi:hypothetical protein